MTLPKIKPFLLTAGFRDGEAKWIKCFATEAEALAYTKTVVTKYTICKKGKLKGTSIPAEGYVEIDTYEDGEPIKYDWIEVIDLSKWIF